MAKYTQMVYHHHTAKPNLTLNNNTTDVKILGCFYAQSNRLPFIKVRFFKVSFAFFCASIAWQASARQDFLSFTTTFVYKQYKAFLFLS